MKRISRYKGLLTLGVLGLFVYIVYAFVSGGHKNEQMICKDIVVKVLNINDAGFVTPDDVSNIVEESGLTGKGKLLDDSIAAKVRLMLESKSYIKNVHTYTTGDSVLHVSLEQRIPVVRIITSSGSCYWDAEAYAFPPSPNYVHDVPLVTGNLPLPYKLPYKGPMPEKGSEFARKLLDFAIYVGQNEFWNVQIQQINVDGNGNVELAMCLGNETVKLGQPENYVHKLDKLLVFYRKVYFYLEKDKYKTFDLRFSDQIVAGSK